MVAKRESEFASDSQQDGYRSYAPGTRFKPVCAPFAAGMARLFPTVTSRAVVRAVFDNRVTFQAITNWRKGRREPPPWAVEKLEAALRASIAPSQEAADRLANAPERLGMAWNKRALTLIGWRARRELEKEKTRS